MNLNEQSLNLNELSQDEREFYALPDRQTMKQYVYGERLAPKEVQKQVNTMVHVKCMIMSACLFTGLFTYAYLLMPMGKILRDIKDSQMSPTRRFLRRSIPFLCIAIPIHMTRSMIENSQRKFIDPK